MTPTPEQILAANKANLETLVGLTTKAFSGVEELIELNLAAAKSAMSDSQEHIHASMSVKDVQELLALQSSLFQPLAEKTASYSRHVYEITSETGAELGKAVEAKATEAQKQMVSFFDSALKNAPAGSESAVTFLKQALNASNTAAESVQKVVKQATDLAESNFHAVTETAAKVSKTVAKKR